MKEKAFQYIKQYLGSLLRKLFSSPFWLNIIRKILHRFRIIRKHPYFNKILLGLIVVLALMILYNFLRNLTIKS